MYGNEVITEQDYNPGFYFCKFDTEVVSLTTIVNADNPEMAYRTGLDKIEKELGITDLTPMYWECELEGH
jgi:hypothetical protein